MKKHLEDRLVLLLVGAGISFCIGLGAACAGSPVRLSVKMPGGEWLVEINMPPLLEGTPYVDPKDKQLIASLPES